jgi:hypothetical protein
MIFRKYTDDLRIWKSASWNDINSVDIIRLLQDRFSNAKISKHKTGELIIDDINFGMQYNIIIEFENDADEAEFLFIMGRS